LPEAIARAPEMGRRYVTDQGITGSASYAFADTVEETGGENLGGRANQGEHRFC